MLNLNDTDKKEYKISKEVEKKILGETFIKPKQVVTYKFNGLKGCTWEIDTKKYPVRFKANPNDDREIHLIWDSSYSGQFDIMCNGHSKTVIVESLF